MKETAGLDGRQRLHWRLSSGAWAAPGGYGELLRIALPLIFSNSVWTLQITLDRVFLSWLGPENVGAAISAVFLFWVPLAFLQSTASYATTFVAQYVGAGRLDRVGPVIWQALYFSLASGLAFLLLIPVADSLVALGDHSTELQRLEATYFRCLCWSALPTLITAATCSFFAGRGDSWTVLLINGVGLVVNGLLDYAWIFGTWGFPAWGIAGAGWATVAGMSMSAVVSLALLLRPAWGRTFALWAGWRFDGELLRRLLYYGLPSGAQWSLDVLAWTGFLFLVGRLGEVELAASSMAFTLNNVAFMPALGIAQAVQILVGQRLGQDQPELAQRSTWAGLRLAWGFMTAVAVLYVLIPDMFLLIFQTSQDSALESQVAELVPLLLRFVAVYSLFDSMNLVFALALKGAGDTRFVTIISFGLAWPLMVLPTWAAWYYGWGVLWAWTFASTYVVVLALVFLGRFWGGRWKDMRVIEPATA